jgi:glycosyltransferase involved in cell wall biosynthesis
LGRLGVSVINRWVADDEIAEIFAAHDAIVLTHVEASQSGVIAAASAQGLPAIVTPVGGLIEQVRHMETGLVAEAVSPEAVVKAILLLANDRNLLRNLGAGLARHAQERSPAVFIQAVLSALQKGAR